jgi:hypothetical protein
MPSAIWAPRRPLSSGSSPKYSGVRPASGVRPLAMPGARMTFRPFAKDSSACSAPFTKARSVSQVDARAICDGKSVTPAARTASGPSV